MAENPYSSSTFAGTRIHSSSIVEEPVSIGDGTSIWHFCHVRAGAVIGARCVIGQGCFVAGRAVIGNGVKLQNHVSVFDGVELEDDVFCGPSAVFTNVMNPRAAVSRRDEFRRTLVKGGATIGANATVLPGITVGEYAFVAAGATITRDVAPYALFAGCPARWIGWMSRHGQRLEFDSSGRARCAATDDEYELIDGGVRLRSAR